MKPWVKIILGGLGSLLLAFVLLIATFWLLFAPENWGKRKARFEMVSSTGMVVVEAIQKYSVEHGAPPPNLQALVPQYLPFVPQTGLRDYPTFQYQVSANSNAPWEVRVECSSGFLNWDVFFYWPTEDYPKQIYGGSTELIGKWAYVHE